jgi:sortase A
MRYRVQVVGWTLIWSGLLVFGYLGWLLFGTDVVNSGIQSAASEELIGRLAEETPTPDSIDSDSYLGETDRPPGVPDTVAFYSEGPPPEGESFAFMSIPAIGLEDVVVYEGTDTATLKNGPGHMVSTPMPGQPGNAVVSGHRTTYGRPFFDVDQLEAGDEIIVDTSIGTHIYRVSQLLVVAPTDVWVTDSRPGGWLTLTTCNPKFSARERLIVFATMVEGPNYDYIRLQEAKLTQT